MALALTILPSPDGGDNSQRRTALYGTALLSGSYTAGGETINWLTLASTSGGDSQINTLTPTTPLWVEFQLGVPIAATPLNYIFQYNYSTGKLQIFQSGASGSGFGELAAGAYPAALTGIAKLYWKAEWRAE